MPTCELCNVGEASLLSGICEECEIEIANVGLNQTYAAAFTEFRLAFDDLVIPPLEALADTLRTLINLVTRWWIDIVDRRP